MTDQDEHVAPVTQLFGGRRASATPDPDDAEVTPGWADPGEPGWAEPGTVSPDEAVDAGQPFGADAPVDADEPAEQPKRVEGAVISALPTYEAFAARSEGPGSTGVGDTRIEGRVGATDDDSADEPEETLEAARARAENISMHALSRRGVSSAELTKTLRSRDLPDEVVADEIERLERVGLLNDAELAENLVRSKQERKGLGKQAITSELRQRGIAQEAIELAIDGIDDDEEQSRADEWAMKRAGQLRGLDQATAERRLNGYLMRRGYRSEVIRRAVERALPRGGSSRGGVRFE